MTSAGRTVPRQDRRRATATCSGEAQVVGVVLATGGVLTPSGVVLTPSGMVRDGSLIAVAERLARAVEGAVHVPCRLAEPEAA
ncbi:hypothetical protein [Streptomyces sp. NBC_01233]|uniref:hypothetical protein n=1 Tax=Streptomyces sp. NBC_01233 TaxID=2903787 RepID=UPI002E11AB44|nr:hypothetical protein OG332_05865 [Streptomyces sp. NBC_01233]